LGAISQARQRSIEDKIIKKDFGFKHGFALGSAGWKWLSAKSVQARCLLKKCNYFSLI
jgi:hypothetical protein